MIVLWVIASGTFKRRNAIEFLTTPVLPTTLKMLHFYPRDYITKFLYPQWAKLKYGRNFQDWWMDIKFIFPLVITFQR